MPRLTQYNATDYEKLLAATEIDASRGALFGAKKGVVNGIKPGTRDRTILIGLGGTGVKTLDYVKGVLQERMDPTWNQYVGMLAIDTDPNEIEAAKYLSSGESINITSQTVDRRVINKNAWPQAWLRFVPENIEISPAGMAFGGAGRKRLFGRIKLHDREPGQLGTDREIVARLIKLRNDMEYTNDGKYQVFVIGSVCGGTCSGTFLEMPALIREALKGRNTYIYSMLYMPDTMAALDPMNPDGMYANGYAALKELNYYQGLSMRKGYTETWGYNDDCRVLKLSSEEGFYSIPYIVDAPQGAAKNSDVAARETIAEFIISLVGHISPTTGPEFPIDSFLSNASQKRGERHMQADNDEIEADGEHHEFPKHFAAIGFAEAAAPKKVVMAYTAGKICADAGIRPVDNAERATIQADTQSRRLIPFCGSENLMNAKEGTMKASELLQPLQKLAKQITMPPVNSFPAPGLCESMDLSWEKLHSGVSVETERKRFVERNTSTEAMKKLTQDITKAYSDFTDNVKNFVKKEGPIAFYNLYIGRFVKTEDGDYGIGIGQILESFRDQKPTGTTVEIKKSPDPATCQKTVNDATSAIMNAQRGLFGFKKRETEAQYSAWCNAILNLTNAEIVDKRRKFVFGKVEKLQELFVNPTSILAEDLKAFGEVLSAMSSIYENQGKKMENFDSFQSQAASDFACEVNIAAINSSAYDWIRNQADRQIEEANANQFRENLVEDFFRNKESWLDIPDSVITDKNGGIALAKEDFAIPARECFDVILGNAIPEMVDITIESMFTELAKTGNSYDSIARDIVKRLKDRSAPLFNGDLPADIFRCYIMYPDALRIKQPEIAKAIAKASDEIFGTGTMVCASDDVDSIMAYQMAVPFEIYRISGLSSWEAKYENQLKQHPGENLLHGKSPDVHEDSDSNGSLYYQERYRWDEYPPITVPSNGQNLRKPDPQTGKLSTEGAQLLELDRQIEKAKSYGLLKCEQDRDGYRVYRVNLDNSVEWTLDTSRCEPNSETGYFPTGTELLDILLEQHNTKLESVKSPVALSAEGGLMYNPHRTAEKAWECAARVLRAHVPMRAELRDSINKVEKAAAKVIAINKEIRQANLPGMMVWMLKANALRKENDIWYIYSAETQKKLVANLSEFVLNHLPPKEKSFLENDMLCFYLFDKLQTILTEEEYEQCYRDAKKAYSTYLDNNNIEKEMLDLGDAQQEMAFAERDNLRAKGARVDGDNRAEPKPTFLSAMESVTTNKELVKKIDLFYGRLERWKAL